MWRAARIRRPAPLDSPPRRASSAHRRVSMSAEVGRVCAGVALLAVLVVACAWGPGSDPPPPRLLLLLVVDQLRPDRLSPGQPDGLGRLQREGRVFSDTRLEHAFTATCPGHAVISTGRHPTRNGIPANYFFSADGTARIYCVADTGPSGVLLAAASSSSAASSASGEEAASDHAPPAPAPGRSPLNLRSDGLADWLKAEDPGARVFAVSAKDRAAITLAGRAADAAYWIDREGTGGFATSRYYREALPAWVRAWDRDRLVSRAPDRWEHPGRDPAGRVRDDDYAPESDRFSRTSPHPIRDPTSPRESLERLAATPHLDRIVLDFALELVDEESLGQREGRSDLLAIGLSATDLIGHRYGPFSQESRAALADLDEALGRFLLALEERLGEGRLLVALTSDHGVLPLPEWVQQADLLENGCPVAGGRVPDRPLREALMAAADAAVGTGHPELGPWLTIDGSGVAFNRARLEATGASPESLAVAVRDRIGEAPALEQVWSRAEIEAGSDAHPDAPMLRLYRNSLVPGRSPDLLVQWRRGCLVTSRSTGTSHGSPHDYDRRIPLLFWGPGIDRGISAVAARAVDVAPSLAALLGIGIPGDVDGRVLPMVDEISD